MPSMSRTPDGVFVNNSDLLLAVRYRTPSRAGTPRFAVCHRSAFRKREIFGTFDRATGSRDALVSHGGAVRS